MDNAESVAQVKAVYAQLDLEQQYARTEEESYGELKALIDNEVASQHPGLQRALSDLLVKIYKRSS